MSERSLIESDFAMTDMFTPPANALAALEFLGMWLGVAFIILLPVELWRQHRGGTLSGRTWLEMAANLSTLIPTALVAGLVFAWVSWLYTSAAALVPWQIPVSWWSALAAILFVDFIYYCDHRIAHRVRILWALMHSVHHSSPIFNQTTALRISFVDGFISPCYYVLPVLLGFDPLLVLAAFGLNLSYQQWIHSEAIGKLGWFDRWFNSPSNHRVHHGSQPQYLDKNYGGILIIWDRLFGTWEPEGDKVVFGITEPIDSVNPWTVHFAELSRLARRFMALSSWTARWRLLVTAPDVEVVDRR